MRSTFAIFVMLATFCSPVSNAGIVSNYNGLKLRSIKASANNILQSSLNHPKQNQKQFVQNLQLLLLKADVHVPEVQQDLLDQNSLPSKDDFPDYNMTSNKDFPKCQLEKNVDAFLTRPMSTLDIYICQRALNESLEYVAQTLIHELIHLSLNSEDECLVTEKEIQIVKMGGITPYQNAYVQECAIR